MSEFTVDWKQEKKPGDEIQLFMVTVFGFAILHGFLNQYFAEKLCEKLQYGKNSLFQKVWNLMISLYDWHVIPSNTPS